MLKEKNRNVKRKIYKFSDMIKDFEYYHSKYIAYKGFTGWCYALDRYSIEELNNVINKYDNTIALYSQCEYAPEIKKTWLFIAD